MLVALLAVAADLTTALRTSCRGEAILVAATRFNTALSSAHAQALKDVMGAGVRWTFEGARTSDLRSSMALLAKTLKHGDRLWIAGNDRVVIGRREASFGGSYVLVLDTGRFREGRYDADWRCMAEGWRVIGLTMGPYRVIGK